MSNAITMGIFWHLIGAASAACFYAPFKKVKKWSWETMWSVGWDCFVDYPAVGHQRPVTTEFLGVLQLI
ncbi:hypothetical protein EIMP300_06060 [Escherichia coli]|uniref:L rhamnose-proton symporter n=1 Tax=Escherichia coli TaxID=562 RepID=A0A8S0FFZ5_ECOLX|nr:hypothetical protein EIMP300_06060 [Escherichia coli]